MWSGQMSSSIFGADPCSDDRKVSCARNCCLLSPYIVVDTRPECFQFFIPLFGFHMASQPSLHARHENPPVPWTCHRPQSGQRVLRPCTTLTWPPLCHAISCHSQRYWLEKKTKNVWSNTCRSPLGQDPGHESILDGLKWQVFFPTVWPV